jgi:hypothetical protein
LPCEGATLEKDYFLPKEYINSQPDWKSNKRKKITEIPHSCVTHSIEEIEFRDGVIKVSHHSMLNPSLKLASPSRIPWRSPRVYVLFFFIHNLYAMAMFYYFQLDRADMINPIIGNSQIKERSILHRIFVDSH